MKYFASLVLISCLFVNAANAKGKYPMELIWDSGTSQNMRNELVSKPTIRADIQEAYDGWVENNCYGQKDYEACLKNPPKPPLADVFDVLAVATPDLNNDGKRDLIIYISGETGMSGNGRCGIMEVWFYENIGSDYRSLGKSEFLHSNQFYLGAPKSKGKFRDIITKDVDGFCSGEKKPKFIGNPYDYKKGVYFPLYIETH